MWNKHKLWYVVEDDNEFVRAKTQNKQTIFVFLKGQESKFCKSEQKSKNDKNKKSF